MRFLLALLVLLAGVPAAQADPDWAAPRGRWHVQGGSASGTGVSAAPGLRGSIEVAWETRCLGTIEGEPLVWDDRIVVASEVDARTRALTVLDLATGEPLAQPRRIPSRLPLEPSLWGHVVVVRTGEGRLDAYSIGGRAITALWSYEGEGALAAPLFFDGRVYVGGSEGLVCVPMGAGAPAWRHSGSYRGRPVVRDGKLTAIRYEDGGKLYLVELDAATGENGRELSLGSHRGGAPPVAAGLALQWFGPNLIAHLPAELESRNLSGDVLWVTREGGIGSTASYRFAPLSAPGAPTPEGFLAVQEVDREGPILGLQDVDTGQITVLAREDLHPELLVESAATLAGEVAYVAGRAVDLETKRILWTSPRPTDRRMVPARETALVVTGGDTVVALREERGRADKPTQLTRSTRTAPLRVADGVAVLRDGTVLEGSFEREHRDDWLVQTDGGRERVLVDDVLLLEREGELHLVGGPAALVRGIEILAARDQAEAFADLARDARHTNDPELLRRLIREAWMRGATDPALGTLETHVAELEARPRTINTRLVDSTLELEERLTSDPARPFWIRAERLASSAPPELLEALLAAVLEREPRHAGATERIGSLLPRGVEVVGPAAEWLEFAVAARTAGVETDDDSAVLDTEQKSWRRDLTAFTSPSLHVVTPVDRPGSVARCLSLGELVCDALDEIFSGGRVVRRNRERLFLALYETQDEYLAHVPEDQKESGLLLHSAGYYEYASNRSHVFVPDGEDGFDRARRTFAHELTHHWIRARCPRLSDDDVALQYSSLAGFWIVEGFASMVEEFEFDMAERTWEPLDPAAKSLDVVTSVPELELVPWQVVLATSRDDYLRLGTSTRVTVPLRGYVGRSQPLSDLTLYYKQSAAVCHYLFNADGGRHRRALRDYLIAYYQGDEEGVDLERAFGVDADELGRRTVEWARGLVP